MKSKTIRNFSLGLASIASVHFAFSVSELQAQLNVNKVLRDATGIYRGGTVGGQYTVTYDNGFPGFTEKLEIETGKVAVPVKRGITRSGMRHPDLPSDVGEDDNGAAAGLARQQPRVTRGGKRVLTNLSGGRIRVDDEPRKGDWTGARTTGTFDKRGKMWYARTSKISSIQRNSPAVGMPPNHSKRVSGLSLKGRG